MSTDDENEEGISVSTVVMDRMDIFVMFDGFDRLLFHPISIHANSWRDLYSNKWLFIYRFQSSHIFESTVQHIHFSIGILFDDSIQSLLSVSSSSVSVYSNTFQGCMWTDIILADV